MTALIVLTIAPLVAASQASEPSLMSVAEALEMPQPAPDHRIEYGADPLQMGELRLPAGSGRFPVAIIIHGGCWLSAYDLGYMSSLAAALTSEGIATWSLEYRRIGDDGGGWPGTFVDVALGADHLVQLADRFPLDLDRVVVIGHSAGGHLALWLAARPRLTTTSPLYQADPLPLRGVISLAGIPDLAAYSADEGCGASVPKLLGGQPKAVGERLRQASPVALLPLGVKQRLLTGSHDPVVPPALARAYAEAAEATGDTVEVTEIQDAGHFELVAPDSHAWPAVRKAVLELCNLTPSDSKPD
jgi:acetyl esterase/lipase